MSQCSQEPTVLKVYDRVWTQNDCTNDLKIAAAPYGPRRLCRRKQQEQYIRVGQVAEDWFVQFQNYFLKKKKKVLLRLFVVQETHKSSLRLAMDKFRISIGHWKHT